MALTGRDLVATAVAALVVVVYVANALEWWYLGSNRWAAVTMSAIGVVGCPLGARLEGESVGAPLVLLGMLGAAALVFVVLAIVTAAHWALLTLMIVLVALWAGATTRHAASPPQRPVAVL